MTNYYDGSCRSTEMERLIQAREQQQRYDVAIMAGQEAGLSSSGALVQGQPKKEDNKNLLLLEDLS